MRCGGVSVRCGVCLHSCRSYRCWWGVIGGVCLVSISCGYILPVIYRGRVLSSAGLPSCGGVWSPSYIMWGWVLLPVSGRAASRVSGGVDLLGVGGAVAGLRSRGCISCRSPAVVDILGRSPALISSAGVSADALRRVSASCSPSYIVGSAARSLRGSLCPSAALCGSLVLPSCAGWYDIGGLSAALLRAVWGQSSRGCVSSAGV